MAALLSSCSSATDADGATGGAGGSGAAGTPLGVSGSVATIGGSVATTGGTSPSAVSGSPAVLPTAGAATGGAVGAGGSAGQSHSGGFAGFGGTSASAGAGGTIGVSGGAGGVAGANMGNSGYGGGGGQPPTFTDGQTGWATRYWDCCKPACGWKGNVGGRTPVQACSKDDQPLGNYDAKNACEPNGEAYMCHSVQPWAVSDTLSYGYAAVNKGSDYCGKCYQLQFTGQSHSGGSDPGSQSLMGKTMIVQAINNGGVDANQFDLLVPGGGVGALDACSKQWGTSDLGEQYGGFYLSCQKTSGGDYAKARDCAKKKCESVFASKPDLLTGCEWFTGWFGAADNPVVSYKEVTCPDLVTKMSGLKR